MTAAGADLTRVTVISPTRRIDLALPGETTLGEIMPNILRFSGYEGGTASDVVHSWVLQRFGEDPLDPTRQVTDLQIRDGETLHLRQLDAAMPDAAFDDVVDAVASTTATQPAWRPRNSVVLSLLVAAALLVGLPLAMLVRHGGLAESLVTAGLAFATGLAAVLTSRAYGLAVPATALAWVCVVQAGLAGYFLLDQGLAITVLTAAACVLLAAAVMGLGARVNTFGFLAVGIIALVVVIAEIVAVLLPGKEVEIAAVAVALVLAFTSSLAPWSYRLARIAMPNLPSSAEALMADDTPVQSDIIRRALLADRLLSAFLLASAGIIVLGCVQVLPRADWFAVALVGCVGLTLVLRSRSFIALAHRLPLLVSGVLILTGTGALALAMMPNDVLRLLVTTGVIVLLAVILVAYAAVYADKIPSPVWGRFGDVFEWLAVIAIVPLTLAVLNLYAWALGLAG
ncbi:MAG TPA: type VII secretion integral membrane protein EccD [Candidatus Avipropionibacterium avicola]|uniref:Type VII secretion integral membrane protein EccD n=1 Tax=Candidatus Avipropionibacterium avicola TaxID=2840701 RepID=A0A9D1GV01_9ACTN|nr:type VII secretion integral membrane protein EccD [Candidatus Avipropionibacterium avicola]